MNFFSRLPILTFIILNFAISLVFVIDIMANTTTEVIHLVNSNTSFALDLYKKVKSKKNNLFFSPYSISSALAMTYAGARNNTATQMAQALHFNLDKSKLHEPFKHIDSVLSSCRQKENIHLKIANSLWPQQEFSLLKDYTNLLKEYYGITVTYLDYKNSLEKARTQINLWVEDHTEKKIKNLIKKGNLTKFTRLVLVNAIYFKSDWANLFNKEFTQNQPFFTTPEKSIDVATMVQTEKLGFAEFQKHTVLELPYINKKLSMIVLLPKKVDGLEDLESDLTAKNINLWTENIDIKKVQIAIPKFKLTLHYDLSKTLVSMGMKDAFSQNKADFSGMDGKKGSLFIGAVIHKAFVEINEEGSEAAAATAVVMRAASIAEPPPMVKIDHPFIFFIRDNTTRSILFLGRVCNPLHN